HECQVAPGEPPSLPCHTRDLMRATTLWAAGEESRASWQRSSQSATDPRASRDRQHICPRRSGSVRYRHWQACSCDPQAKSVQPSIQYIANALYVNHEMDRNAAGFVDTGQFGVASIFNRF